MMQMLRAGGVEVWEDDHRAPDDNNPRGYVELQQEDLDNLDDDEIAGWFK